jgi:hypothetical protein
MKTPIRKAMMKNISQSVLKTMGYTFTGRVHFKKQRLGQVIAGEDGQNYTIFREIVVDRHPGQPEKPGAVFVLRFQVTNLSPRQNQIFSLLPIPLYTINGSHCQSIYEFDTVQDAENYSRSTALMFITRRSVPGSVSYKIIPAKS